MTHCENGVLLYRASRDGFTASAFHSKCDGKANTITIVKNNFNYVFGGYTAAKWTSDRSYSADTTAFIFSLRRNGVSNSNKFHITEENSAIFGFSNYGATFGHYDIFISDRADCKTGSLTNIGCSYELPSSFSTQSENTKSFLSGNYNNWLAIEIEVYQIYK